MQRPTSVPGGFTESEWREGLPWDAYLGSVDRDLWHAQWEQARIGEEEAARLRELPGPRRILVLTEDWCGDAARSVPVLARAFADAPLADARYLAARRHDETMLRYLTHGGRSIPLAIVQDEHGRELGAWGPRPAPLQALFRARQRGAVTVEDRRALRGPLLAWYEADRGRTAVQEVLMLLERGGKPRE